MILDEETLQQARILLQSCDRRDFDKVFCYLQQLIPLLTKESVADLCPCSRDERAVRKLVQLCDSSDHHVIASLPSLKGVVVVDDFDKQWLARSWHTCLRNYLRDLWSTARWSVYDFFHARTKDTKVFGTMRIAYALLFLYSRGWLFANEIAFLMDPQTGVMPYRSTQHTLDDDDDLTLSLFRMFPDSPALLYGLMAMGILNGVLLLVGVAPRFQALGIFVFYCQFGNHDSALSDHQDVMMRMYALMLALAPIHHVTLWDGFGCTKQKKNCSWPMWPIRCWQILVCLIYVGAGYGKLSSDVWRNGEALYYPPYEEGFGRFWNPDFIFNRLWPIKILTWSSLVLECTCMFTIWPKATRKLTLFCVVGFHLGIELTMIMHIFQYISVLGWCSFLVQPTVASCQAKQPRRTRSVGENRKSKLVQTAVALFFMSLFVVDTLPTGHILRCLPDNDSFAWFHRYIHRPIQKARTSFDPFLKRTGLRMGVWTLFSGIPYHANHRYTAVIRFQNQSEPIVWQCPNWQTSSWWERELMMWSDAYYYYLWNDAETSFPLLTTFMEHLARTYSGAIHYEPRNATHGERLRIDPNNTLHSISLLRHQEQGQKLSYSDTLDWWSDPVRRPTIKSSDCLYYWKFPKPRDDHRVQYKPVRYTLLDDIPLDAQTGCKRYDATDTQYHMVGSYEEETV